MRRRFRYHDSDLVGSLGYTQRRFAPVRRYVEQLARALADTGSNGTPPRGCRLTQPDRDGRPRHKRGAPDRVGRVPLLASGRYARGFSRISKVSITSPTLMSLKLPKVRPHSKPSRTSVASSLKRFSEVMVRLSWTTAPSRRSRARAFRRMTPERT